jgi:hypothetical protein
MMKADGGHQRNNQLTMGAA